MIKNRPVMISIVVVTLLVIMTAAFAATAGAVSDVTAPVVTNVVPADGSTVYSNGSTTVIAISANYSDEPGGSGVDPTSVMVHVDIGNMLFDCPTQTESRVSCNAAATDLPAGIHPIDIFVADMAGNLTVNRTWVTVAIDSGVPSYANLAPADGSIIYTSQLNSASINDMSALRINYDIIDPAPSSGVIPMTHINDSFPPGGSMGAMISNSSCVKTPNATNPTHYSCQMNRAALLHLGDNRLSVLLKDKVGNSNYTDPASVNTYTVVDDVAPAVSGVSADASTISASYSDPLPTGALSTQLASGIDAATAMVHVDGTMIMNGCTPSATGISCPTPAGLAVGTHDIEVMVDDNAGNQGMAMGTLTIETPPCSAGKPALGLRLNSAYWNGPDDYRDGVLSVSMQINNNGSAIAKNVQMTSSVPSLGAALETPMPTAIGDIAAGGSGGVVLQYTVEAGVQGFRINNEAAADDACGSAYSYP